MGHRIGLFAQLEQATGNAAGHVEKGQVADFASGVTQALGHLAAQCVENFRILGGQLAEFSIADLGHFAFGLGADPCAALVVLALAFEQPQLAEKITGIEVGNDHFPVIVIFDQDGD
ncbi:hypothetical protein D9M71_710730 [compost metagenome]